MKIKRSQINELIRLITRQVLREYTVMSSQAASGDSSITPEDAMTPVEKAKKAREEREQAKHELDLAKKSKDTEKEKAEAFKSQYDQWRTYGKKDGEQKVQDLTKKVTGI